MQTGPNFDPETGFPRTAKGEQIVAKSWLEEAVPTSGEDMVHVHDFRVPFNTIQQATQNFSKAKRIGGGGSCFVYKGDVYGVTVAIKALKYSDDDTDESMLSLESKQFFAEMKLLQAVRHPNICRLLAVSVDGARRCLLLPLCSGGDLSHRIKKLDPSLTCAQRVQVALAILLALQHLHSVKMIHRDVKTQNVLLLHVDVDGEDMTPLTKLADFGTVRDDVRHRKLSHQTTSTDNIRSHSSTKQVIGTRPYMSPEYHMMGQVSEKTDGFAAGIVLMELLTGLNPTYCRALLNECGDEGIGKDLIDIRNAKASSSDSDPQHIDPGDPAIASNATGGIGETDLLSRVLHDNDMHRLLQQWEPSTLLALGGIVDGLTDKARRRIRIADVIPALQKLVGVNGSGSGSGDTITDHNTSPVITMRNKAQASSSISSNNPSNEGLPLTTGDSTFHTASGGVAATAGAGGDGSEGHVNFGDTNTPYTELKDGGNSNTMGVLELEEGTGDNGNGKRKGKGKGYVRSGGSKQVAMCVVCSLLVVLAVVLAVELPKHGGNSSRNSSSTSSNQCWADLSNPTCTCTGTASSKLSKLDCAVWVQIYDTNGGKDWKYCTGNRLDPCACNFTTIKTGGIECSGQSITSLNFNYFRLTGILPSASIAKLTNLQSFYIQCNALTGYIPQLPYMKYASGLQDGCAIGGPAVGGYCNSNKWSCPLVSSLAPDYAFANGEGGCVASCSNYPCWADLSNPTCTCTGTASSKLSKLDCAVWVQIYDTNGGKDWKYCTGNRLDPCACNFTTDVDSGVVCSGNSITALYLKGLGLANSLNSSSIAMLDDLIGFQVDCNGLSGQIPQLLYSQYVARCVLGGSMFSGCASVGPSNQWSCPLTSTLDPAFKGPGSGSTGTAGCDASCS